MIPTEEEMKGAVERLSKFGEAASDYASAAIAKASRPSTEGGEHG